MKHNFKIEFTVYADLEIDQAVFDNVDDEFRQRIYNFEERYQIIEHIAAALLRGYTLSHLDGFANLPDENAKISNIDYEYFEFKTQVAK